jgi:hypothetical protein
MSGQELWVKIAIAGGMKFGDKVRASVQQRACAMHRAVADADRAAGAITAVVDAGLPVMPALTSPPQLPSRGSRQNRGGQFAVPSRVELGEYVRIGTG